MKTDGMNDLFEDRLAMLEDPEDRRILKRIINTVFSDLVEYSEQGLADIEKRVNDEISDRESQFDIYTSITSLADYDPSDKLFWPILSDDIEPADIRNAKRKEAIQNEERPVLEKVYLDIDSCRLMELEKQLQNRRFQGELKTTEQQYQISVSLTPCTAYQQEIEKLYDIFLNNKIPWRTVLHPHLKKIIEIRLESAVMLAENEMIMDIDFDLEELKEFQRFEQIPLWSIRRLVIPNEFFAGPSAGEEYHEYTIPTGLYGEGYGYLLDAEPETIYRLEYCESHLTLFSRKRVDSSWQILQFCQPEEVQKDNITGNHRRERFTDRFARRENHTIRTISELIRLTGAFTAASDLELVSAEVRDAGTGNQETYEMNPFIRDSIRNEAEKKVLQLSFTGERTSNLSRDIMSFLVSEIQMHYPELKCVGELLQAEND